jgi:hypothetical protein
MRSDIDQDDEPIAQGGGKAAIVRGGTSGTRTASVTTLARERGGTDPDDTVAEEGLYGSDLTLSLAAPRTTTGGLP